MIPLTPRDESRRPCFNPSISDTTVWTVSWVAPSAARLLISRRANSLSSKACTSSFTTCCPRWQIEDRPHIAGLDQRIGVQIGRYISATLEHREPRHPIVGSLQDLSRFIREFTLDDVRRTRCRSAAALLLHDVVQLVGQQPPAARAGRVAVGPPEEDVLTDREGPRLQRLVELIGAAVGVQSNATEVSTERPLQVAAWLVRQRPAASRAWATALGTSPAAGPPRAAAVIGRTPAAWSADRPPLPISWAMRCLVNNAGVTSHVRGDVLDLAPDSFDHVMAVNLRGTFFLTQAVARRMAARPTKAFRSIVTIGSANAEIVGENRADYCMSKAALAMMSKIFAARLAPLGIAVFEVRPGIIRTAMTAPAAERYDGFIAAGGVPMGRWGEPADIAAAVAALARGNILPTGIAVDVGGGLNLHRL